jgi:putative hydrolase of the HAD superfamily
MSRSTQNLNQAVLFDWGDTVMREIPGFRGPMVDWPRIEIVPFIEEALQAVQMGWLTAIATNATDSDEIQIRAALQKGALDLYFDRIFCYRGVGYRKPSAEFFNHIQRALGFSANQLVMVGDNFEVDVLGPVRLGIRAIWFNEHSNDSRSGGLIRTIHDLRELPGALAELDAFAKS